MTLQLIEGAITALVTYLDGAFPTKILALNAEYDNIILEDIVGIDAVEQVEREAQDYPHIDVLGIRTDIVSETMNTVISLHNIALICTMMDDISRLELRTKGYRYARAIFELLKTARSTGALSGYTIKAISPLDFGPLRWSRDKSKVIANIIVLVQISTTEVF